MAGTIDLNGMGGSLHSVEKLFVHQNYTKQFQADVQGDIALLRLAKRFSYDSNIQPIKLGTVYDGAKAVVVGWGSESNEYPVASQILKSVKMMVIPGDAACQTDATRVCAAAQTGTGTCMGDSGAPLVDVDSGKLLGIFSLGVQRGCGLGLADIFTKVEPYAKWIDYVKTI
jgi:secreted trypsin-like serine protease